MDGATLRAGAVADVTHTRYPITLARAVMEKTPYVLLVGPGADAFSLEAGMEQEGAAYFFTESRWQSLVKQLQKEGKPIPPRPAGAPTAEQAVPLAQWQEPADMRRFGTVGVVALDRQGNVAAGHIDGRVAGQDAGPRGRFAADRRRNVRFESVVRRFGHRRGRVFSFATQWRATICALVQFKGLTLQQAADEVIHKQLAPIHGDGGVIAIAPDGQLAWSFNTSGMFRGRQVEGGQD